MRRNLLIAAAAAAAAVIAGILLVTGTFGGAKDAGNSGTGSPWQGGSNAGGTGAGGASVSGAAGRMTLRLGFVADVTQAPALVGLREGLFAAALHGTGLVLRPVPFRTDAAEAEALAAGKLDAAYTSPDSILAVLADSHGTKITVVSGTAAGGAVLVVRPGLASPSGLGGRTLAVPAAGGAQDVALRYWLAAQRIQAGRGGVAIADVAPGAVVGEFRSGRISGAWMPALYDVELAEAGGRVLATEESMPPDRRPAAVNLVVTRAFLAGHSAGVLALIKGQVQANDLVNHSLLVSAAAVTAELAALDGSRPPASLVGASLAQTTFTDDPGAASLAADVPPGLHASVAPALPARYDVAPLNLILRMAGEQPVSA
jgi:NitT/TauT family transport system substrate-binding protein